MPAAFGAHPLHVTPETTIEGHLCASGFGAVYERAERIHLLAVEFDVHPYQVGFAVVDDVVIK